MSDDEINHQHAETYYEEQAEHRGVDYGASDSLETDLYIVIDKKNRIIRKRQPL